MTAAICSGCGRPTDECCVGDGCVPVEDQEQPLVAADGVEPVPGSPVHAPVAATGDLRPNVLNIERRIQIRRFIYECREAGTANLALPVDEIEALLRCYEHGRFQT